MYNAKQTLNYHQLMNKYRQLKSELYISTQSEYTHKVYKFINVSHIVISNKPSYHSEINDNLFNRS